MRGCVASLEIWPENKKRVSVKFHEASLQKFCEGINICGWNIYKSLSKRNSYILKKTFAVLSW